MTSTFGGSVSGHAELARLVVELESTDTHTKPNMQLGQNAERRAHMGIGSEESLNLIQKEAEETPERAIMSKDEFKQCQKGNPDTLQRVEAGSGSESGSGSRRESRNINPNHNKEGHCAAGFNQEEMIERGLSEAEVAETGSTTKTQPRKHKAIRELGDANTFPRRSVRLSEKHLQKQDVLEYREGTFSASISDGDILLCNARVLSPGSREESDNLWEVGKQFGLTCRGVEDEVVQEFNILEDRDQEEKNNAERGRPSELDADL